MMIAITLGAQVVAAATTPDPLALLRGVEGVRQACRSGRFDIRVKISNPGEPTRSPQELTLAVAFDGPNLRFDQYQKVVIVNSSASPDPTAQDRQLKGMGGDLDTFVKAGHGAYKDAHTRSAFDGTRFLRYSEDHGATVLDLKKGSPGLVFDPRTLGLDVWIDINDTTAKCLAYSNAKSVSIVDRAVVQEQACWQVRVLDSYDQDRRFWIGDDSFRVYKCSFNANGQRLETISTYDKQGPNLTLPESVVTREFDPSGRVKQLTEISITKAGYNVAVDPKLWTLAGLGMPLGQMVSDERIHQVVGHFDGVGLTPQFSDAILKGKAARWAPLYWGLAIAGLMVVSVLAAFVVHRHNLKRREA